MRKFGAAVPAQATGEVRPRVPFFACLAVALCACASGQTATLGPVPFQTVAVSDTLIVPLVVSGSGGSDLALRFQGPDLPDLAATTSIVGGAAGGEFRWTPLANQVGAHDFTFLLMSGDEVVDRRGTVIEVTPATDAAPIFLRPGAGGTFDLTKDPCVKFDAEVRDADSTVVTIGSRDTLPDGAEIGNAMPKSASFTWCPTPAQISQSERWNVVLTADDGDHPPTQHNYVIVLRTAPKSNCPGTPPVIAITSPSEGEKRDNEPGYTVRASITDDKGLRDAPLLYYTTTAPDDPNHPDITEFAQVEFTQDGDTWKARVPSLGLSVDEEKPVYVVVSATDNDDSSGATCDLRSDSALLKFVAVGRDAVAPTCATCDTSSQCASGICAATIGGGACIDSCSTQNQCKKGICATRVTMDGALVSGCGTVAEVCDPEPPPPICVNDAFEPNDTRTTATALSTNPVKGQICDGDKDYFRIAAAQNTRVNVTLDSFTSNDGDLDLALYDGNGQLLDVSDSEFDVETVSYCAMESANIYAVVYGYRDQENPYRVTTSQVSASCCVDDAYEQDDTFAGARTLSGTSFNGTICPGDDDYIKFTVTGPTNMRGAIQFTHANGDLELDLLDSTGTVLATSSTEANQEAIDGRITEAGTYALRIYGFQGAHNTYVGTLTLTADTTCTSTRQCAIGTVCSGSTCKDDACTSVAECPSSHLCVPDGVASTPKSCDAVCTVNGDCRGNEACKRLTAGRACIKTGSGANGAACVNHADCGGQRACLPFPGGYCARAGCTSNADCESGTYCVNVNGINACALSCAGGGCRSAYTCTARTDVGGTSHSVCVP